jgi:hypothetical protein
VVVHLYEVTQGNFLFLGMAVVFGKTHYTLRQPCSPGLMRLFWKYPVPRRKPRRKTKEEEEEGGKGGTLKLRLPNRHEARLPNMSECFPCGDVVF